MRKCSAVTTAASSVRPAPAAMPIAAASHTDAAVVSPRTRPRWVRISPPPMNPTPETIWAATRDGSTTTRRGARTSVKPNLLTSTINAELVPTMAVVRSPAGLPRSCRSRPTSDVSPQATSSDATCGHPCPWAAAASEASIGGVGEVGTVGIRPLPVTGAPQPLPFSYHARRGQDKSG